MQPTEQQRKAIDLHDQNLIVVAGAGSGKTWVLVERYLALLDNNPDWGLNQLVAITFTRKAAQEMRDRVRQALEGRYQTAINDAARAIWARRLSSMDTARIDTIHGLCAAILRANAAEAQLDPDFEVLDETEAHILLGDTLETVLNQLVDTRDPALDLFREYDAYALQQTLRNHISTELADLPDNTDWMALWTAEWEQSALQEIQMLLENVEFTTAANWQPDSLPDEHTEDKLLAVWLDCHLGLERLFSAASQGDVATCSAALQALGSGIKINVGSAGSWGSKEALREVKDTLDFIRECVRNSLKSLGDPPGELDLRAARYLPHWHRLIRQMQAAYRQAKQERAALDFDDLEQRTSALLSGHEAVRLRYRDKEFRHLMVDEFQDTNARQWEIVRSLADPAQPGSLFVVGDQKQSIYAFRGADVRVFGEVRQEIARLGGDEVALARSFRTHQPLVDGFNALFAHILTRSDDPYIRAYETDLDTPMEAARLDAPSDHPALEVLLVDSDAVKDSETARRWEAYEIARRLQQLVADDVPIFDKKAQVHRPIQYDDMVLLFQSMSNITLYEEVFKALKLPFVTVAGKGYYDRQEVWDLINLLRGLYNPLDNLALASALRSPLFGLSDDALLALRLLRAAGGERLSLRDALNHADALPANEHDLVAFAADCLTELEALAGRVTISELLRAALVRTGYLATLSALPDGARRRGNIEKLLDKAESSGKVTLGAFSQYLEDLSASEAREGEAALDITGSVTLMSVHKSKGLEYPLVVLVDSTWESGNWGSDLLLRRDEGWLACRVYDEAEAKAVDTFAYRQAKRLNDLREGAERKRLLYVAATRAQDYLLVTGRVSQNQGGIWKMGGWLTLLDGALNLSEHLQSGEQFMDYDWGRVQLTLQDTPPDEAVYRLNEAAGSAWDSAAIQAAQPLPGEMTQPALLRQVRVDRTAGARHLSVTQIADLGAASVYKHSEVYRQRFLRSVLHDAPARIESAVREPNYRRLIGEIVHEALHWWRFPNDEDQLTDLLESYAWEQGIVDPSKRQEAVDSASRLLTDFQKSEVYAWVANSRVQYRELPFIYQTDQRIIHGIIDLLLQRADGVWTIIDYKTSAVYGSVLPDQPSDEDIRQHARRYHLQVGAYAAAVQRQLRDALKVDVDDIEVYIHYIRYQRTIRVSRAEWEPALANLNDLIGSVIG